MKKNMGKIDKTIRVLLAVVIGALYFTGVIQGVLAVVLSIFSVVFVLTSFVSFCPAYLPFGISTCKRK